MFLIWPPIRLWLKKSSVSQHQEILRQCAEICGTGSPKILWDTANYENLWKCFYLRFQFMIYTLSSLKAWLMYSFNNNLIFLQCWWLVCNLPTLMDKVLDGCWRSHSFFLLHTYNSDPRRILVLFVTPRGFKCWRTTQSVLGSAFQMFIHGVYVLIGRLVELYWINSTLV